MNAQSEYSIIPIYLSLSLSQDRIYTQGIDFFPMAFSLAKPV